MNLVQLRDATQATWNAFRDAPLVWRGVTCVHVLHAHLINTGHQPPAVPAFKTKAGARKALSDIGASNLIDLLKFVGLPEITPAMMRLGDIAVVPGEGNRIDGIRAAIFICAGNGKFMGWHELADGFTMVDDPMPHVKAAFRV